jgi:hypothetical protein
MAWTAPSTKTTGTLVTAAIWNEQVTNNMTWLGTSHDHNGGAGDGGTLAVVSGLIGIFDAACPTGWTRVSAWDSKMIRGAAAYGATGGADTHTHSHLHTVSAHTHDQIYSSKDQTVSASLVVAVAPSGSAMTVTGGGGAAAYRMQSGAASGGSGNTGNDATAGSSLPAYISVIFCKKD